LKVLFDYRLFSSTVTSTSGQIIVVCDKGFRRDRISDSLTTIKSNLQEHVEIHANVPLQPYATQVHLDHDGEEEWSGVR